MSACLDCDSPYHSSCSRSNPQPFAGKPTFGRTSTMTDAPWVVVDFDGSILDRFVTEQERDEALMTGDYPDEAEPAYVNDPSIQEA